MPSGEHRPAEVIRAWSETCVNLDVTLDGTNDGAVPGTHLWKTSVSLDEQGKKHSTWHWPEEDEAAAPTNVAQRAHEPIAEASAQTVAPAGVASAETVGTL